MTVLQELIDDVNHLRIAAKFEDSVCGHLRAVFATDSYRLLALNRVREAARRSRVPLVNAVLRSVQQALCGIEIGKDVTLGAGVYFVHPVGVVLGGNSQIGKRVRFYGSNTIGTVSDDGYPIVEDDVVIGAGARILGKVRIGARARIGANAVVLIDVPADGIAYGVPARLKTAAAPTSLERGFVPRPSVAA